MTKRKRLGQHFLLSESIAKKILDSANLTCNDTVLEIGTGKGILTPLLCSKANKVISIEKDKVLFDLALAQFSNISNLKMIFGDGFKLNENFNVFVSNLPYSESRRAIEWLSSRRFDKAIIMVQKEFSDKIQTRDKKHRRAISVIASYAFEMKKVTMVGKENFSPPPKVDSVVLCLTSKNVVSKEIVQVINKLFSYRNKTVHNILKQFGIIEESNKRLDELENDEIIDLAKRISQIR